MRWKQFLTPVDSVSPEEARKIMEEAPEDDYVLLDVRQPGEYQAGHVPGAVLKPLPDLKETMERLDRDRRYIVYCAVGGRSRAAAQIMAGQGFNHVINMKGGFNAWQGREALGGVDKGMEVFTGAESVQDVLTTAYGLEEGLREYYLSLKDKAAEPKVAEVFERLARVEELHKDRILAEYERIDPDFDRRAFLSGDIPKAMEGGLTAKEYADLFYPDLDSPEGVVDLAMSIEVQALDLYMRAAGRAPDDTAREFLVSMADEERGHLKQLGRLMDQVAAREA